MTKKKKSILSDQRFIVLLVIIVLFAIFSFKSREFRQYTTILSMLDFSYYDLLMAIGVTFPLITGGVDLSIGTGMVCYALIGGTLVRSNNVPVVVAMLLCVVLGIAIGALNGVLIGIMNLPPLVKFTGFSPYGMTGQVLVFAREGVLPSTIKDMAARAIAGSGTEYLVEDGGSSGNL